MKYKLKIRTQVRNLFSSMSSDISMEDFNNKVEDFRAQYKSKEENEVVKIHLGDIMECMAFNGNNSKEIVEMDFYVRRDNKAKERIQINFERPENIEFYCGCRINRLGFSLSYITAILQSSYVYNEYDFRNRNVSVARLKDVLIPYEPVRIQETFDKIVNYTKTQEYIQSLFFVNVLDYMVEEIFNQKLFNFQNVKLIEKTMMLENVPENNSEQFISNVYNHITHESGGLMEELIAAKSVKGSHEVTTTK